MLLFLQPFNSFYVISSELRYPHFTITRQVPEAAEQYYVTGDSSLFVCLFVCLFVWVDALRPQSTADVMSGRSFILSTLFLGKPPRGR